MEDGMKARDVSRLCEALGLDSSAYVSFEKQARAKKSRGEGVAEQPSRDDPFTMTTLPFSWRSVQKQAGVERQSVNAGARTTAAETVRDVCMPMQMAMLSLSGGSGKTTIAAALANGLRAQGHSVLLADHSQYNTMQSLFGLREERSTAVSFAMGTRVGSPLPVLSRYHQGEPIEDFDAWLESLAARTSFTFFDGIGDSVSQGKALISSGVRILIPVVPDVVSAMSAVKLDRALSTPWPGRVMYMLNRFDANQGLHRDVRIWLRENLGARLLPFEIPDDADVRQVATGALLIKDLAPFSAASVGLELLVDLVARCGMPEQSQGLEVRQ